MASKLSIDERFRLITRGIPDENVSGDDIILSTLQSGRQPKVLWVTSPTGKPHVGYFIPLLKFADFLDAGCKIIIVLLDVYSFLDNVKYPMEQVVQRMKYYEFTIKAAIFSLGISSENITFVQESTYQLTPEFMKDQWRLCTLLPQQAVRDAWDRSYNPSMLSPMLCPGIQTLAEEHLDIDIQFGGADQRGIFSLAEEYLPRLGYRQRAHLMNPMLPNLIGTKMSSSHPPETKIMYQDSPKTLAQKIREAPWPKAGAAEPTNGIFGLVRDILIPAAKLQQQSGIESSEKTVAPTLKALGGREGVPQGTLFSVPTRDGLQYYQSAAEVAADLDKGTITVVELKEAVTKGLDFLLEPVRLKYSKSEDWRSVDELGYPEE